MDASAGTRVGSPGQGWNGRSLGGTWLFASCAWLLRFVGVRGALVGSYIIALGFLICGGRRQFGSLAYWRRLRPRAGIIVHFMLVLRHYASFGRILCDRLLVYLQPGAFHFSYRGGGHLRRAVGGSGGACILLAAHVGNWELSGFRLGSLSAHRVNLVMIRDDLPYVQTYVDQRMRGDGISVIDPRDPLGASLAIFAALGRDEVVCMLGDRLIDRQPGVRVPFLGGQASFPIGPFHTAAVTGVPLLICFLVKVGLRSYRLEVDPPWHIELPARGPARDQAMEAIVATWARRLEQEVRRHPLQWHNFFDFWSGPQKAPRRTAPPV